MPRIFRRLTIGGCAMSLLLSANPSAMAQQALTGSGQGQRDPISIGILLEASRDFASRLDAARNGIDLFLDALEPEDEVFLMTFSDIPALKHDFTQDREAISEAMGPILSFGQAVLYRSLIEALAKVEEGRHDKKVIVLVTAGQISEPDFAKSREAVRSSGAAVYGLGMPLMSGSGYSQDVRGLTAAEDESPGEPFGAGRLTSIDPAVICERALKAFAEDSGGAYGIVPLIRSRLREYSVEPAFQAMAEHLANRD